MYNFPFFHQHDAMDCGATCLRMIAKYYGKNYSLETLRERTYITREGVSMLGISEAAEKIGLHTLGVRASFEKLIEAPTPFIVHWNQNHFVVVYEIKKLKMKNEKMKVIKSPNNFQLSTFNFQLKVADPAQGLIKYTLEEFLAGWLSTKKEGEEEGVALLFETTPDFYAIEDEKPDKTKFKFVLQYLRPYKKLIVQLFLGMLIGTGLQLIFPFLTQSIVDYGIGNNNLSFIVVILIAQLTLYTAQTAVEFIRSWILLHITTRINISIISDFLFKLMKLPLGFFDTKMIGDLMQRIGDHTRIQNFLTSSTLNTLFSLVSFVVFTIVLAFYNLKLLAVFLIASVLYILWITIFLKKRRELDMKRFAQASAEQSTLYQLITGMQEIKLNNCEKQKRWEWENIQAKLFKVSTKGLALAQYQQSGAFFINETKNILISFFAAYSVIQGEMTLGMMMAVQYIIGQLNSPINQVIGFIQSAQDAKISLERLGEIHNKPDEEDTTMENGELKSESDKKSEQLSTFNFQLSTKKTLGDLQSPYLAFVKAAEDWDYFVKADYHQKKIQIIEKQIVTQKSILRKTQNQLALTQRQLISAQQLYGIDSSLFAKKVLSQFEFENSKNSYLQQLQSYESAKLSIDNQQMTVLQLEQSIFDLEQQRVEQENSLRITLTAAHDQLLTQIKNWEQTYLLVAPCDGVVTFTKYWQQNQNINAGEVLVTVVPQEKTEITGKILLPPQGAGKVKEGQTVNVKFDNFPYMEYGMVRVKISKISLIPIEVGEGQKMYLLEVVFPDNLVTNYGKELVFSQEMTGKAEIITEDLRLLDKFINPIKAVINK